MLSLFLFDVDVMTSTIDEEKRVTDRVEISLQK